MRWRCIKSSWKNSVSVAYEESVPLPSSTYDQLVLFHKIIPHICQPDRSSNG
jgi:hypothetical protein